MIYKRLAEYIQENIPGCSFVGIEEDSGELFVSFSHDDTDKKVAATKELLEKFDEVKKIAIVERVDIKEATKMVEELNKLLEEEQKGPQILDIGEF